MVQGDSRGSPSEDHSIFPPSNHEGLHITSQGEQDAPSSSSFSSSPSSDLNVDAPPLDSSLSRWFAFGLHLLHSKIVASASSFRRYSSTRRTFWSFGPAAGAITAVALAFVCLTLRRRRRRHSLERNLDHLTLLMNERDEKIIQLLHRIIQMNEVLLGHHKVGAVRSS